MSVTSVYAPALGNVGKQPSYRAEEMQLYAEQLLGENTRLKSKLEEMLEIFEGYEYEISTLKGYLAHSEEYGNDMRDRAEDAVKQLETCRELHHTRERSLLDRIDSLLLNRVPKPPWAQTRSPTAPRGPSPPGDAPEVSPFLLASEKRTGALHLPEVIRAAIPADVQDKDAYAAYLLGPPPSSLSAASAAPLKLPISLMASRAPSPSLPTPVGVTPPFIDGSGNSLPDSQHGSYWSEDSYKPGYGEVFPDGTTSPGACESDNDPFDADAIDALGKQMEREHLAELLVTEEYSEA
jgi:hypothetical protein